MSNTLAVKLSLNNETPFNSDWRSASHRVRLDVERCEAFWTEKRHHSKTFLECCNSFRLSAVGRSFGGFKLQGTERDLLREKILAISPFLSPLNEQPERFLSPENDLNLPVLARAVGNEEFRGIVTAAGLVNDLISPFRQMYKMIADRKEPMLRNHRFEALNIRRAQAGLKDSSIFAELAAVIEVVGPWVTELVNNRGYPNENLVQHLKDRASDVVTGRGKTPPHLIAPEQRRSGKDMNSELNIIESSFRLGNASLILRDVFGSRNAI